MKQSMSTLFSHFFTFFSFFLNYLSKKTIFYKFLQEIHIIKPLSHLDNVLKNHNVQYEISVDHTDKYVH